MGRKLASNIVLVDPVTAESRVFQIGDEVPDDFAAQISNDAVFEPAEAEDTGKPSGRRRS